MYSSESYAVEVFCADGKKNEKHSFNRIIDEATKDEYVNALKGVLTEGKIKVYTRTIIQTDDIIL